MKGLFKRTSACLLAIAMIFGVSGCGEKAAKSGDTTEITVWTGNTHNKSFMDKKVEEWNSTIGNEKGIKINYVVQTGDINEKINLSFTNGQAPDIFYGGTLIEQIENNQIVALEDIEGSAEFVETFSPWLVEDTHLYNGKTYSLPFGVYTCGLIYNKDMFKAAGIVDENGEAMPPKTLKEMREYAKKLTNPDKKQYGIIFTGKYGGFYGDDVLKVAARSCGFTAFNFATGKYDYTAQAEVMKTYMGIKEDGSCYPGTESMDNDPARALFASGAVGMKTAVSYDYAVLTDQFPAEIEWGVAPFPVIDENEQYKSYMFCNAYLKINKESADKIDHSKLLEVYKWFYSDEMMIDAYKGGFDIPVKWDAVKDVELDEDMDAWRDFAALQENSFNQGPAVQTDMTGEKSLQEIWMNDIWAGKIPVDDIDKVVAEYTEKSNAGIETYAKMHPDYDGSKYIIPDWNTKID